MRILKLLLSNIALPACLLLFSIPALAQIKVACIGDSITEGAGLQTSETYPTQLQGLLKTSYEVRNYGKSGSSLLRSGRLAYWKQTVYQLALQWNPDIVIIKLGTNDSKDEYWVYKEDFYKDYVDFINSFKNLTSKPKIYICYPLPAFRNRFGIQEDVIKKEIIPYVKQIAKETNTTFIDLYTPFHGKSTLLGDGVHPNATGAKFLAQEVYKAIGR